MEFLYSTESEISDQLLAYIEEKADVLSKAAIQEIERYIDSESMNPLMHAYLVTEDSNRILEDVQGEVHESMTKAFVAPETISSFAFVPQFKKLKRKVRITFCHCVENLVNLKRKQLILNVLTSLLSVFKMGVPLVVLPLLVGMIAVFMKKGDDYLCKSN